MLYALCFIIIITDQGDQTEGLEGERLEKKDVKRLFCLSVFKPNLRNL
jgi:hypothetical protein